MGVDFRSAVTGATLRMSWELWNTLFFIGQDFGWTPAGTIHDHASWDGSYHSNSGQMVAAADAVALAGALRAALARVETAGEYGSDPSMTSDNGTPITDTETLLDELWAVRGLPPDRVKRRHILQRRADAIRQVIAFLEQGAFSIY